MSSVSFFLFLKILFIHSFESGREIKREQEQGEGAEGEGRSRGRDWARSLTWGLIPGPWGYYLSWRQMLGWLKHPGAPSVFFKQHIVTPQWAMKSRVGCLTDWATHMALIFFMLEKNYLIHSSFWLSIFMISCFLRESWALYLSIPPLLVWTLSKIKDTIPQGLFWDPLGDLAICTAWEYNHSFPLADWFLTTKPVAKQSRWFSPQFVG